RVAHTFGVGPEDLRYVATSATIGGPESDEQLRKFLADIAGVPLDRVVVVTGNRSRPTTPKPGEPEPVALDALDEMRTEQRFEALSHDPRAVALRTSLAERGFATLGEIAKQWTGREAPSRVDRQETLRLLDHCSSA